MDAKFNVHRKFNMLKFKRQIKFLSLMGVITALIILTAVTAPSSHPQPATTSTPQPTVELVDTPSNQPLLEAPNNQKPTEVTTGVYINNLVSLNPSDENFEITGYLYSSWKDPRLSSKLKEKGLKQTTTYSEKDIWVPKLGLTNSEEFKEVDNYLGVDADNTVQHIQTFEARLSSKLFLEFFPLTLKNF